MKEILIGCERGIYRVEICEGSDKGYQCRVKEKHRVDEEWSNFEVKTSGETILVCCQEAQVNKIYLYNVNSKSML